jgi:NAD(P)-dependent dehydrogenase (short-subunit alcohol dehydrogenase family)
MFDLSDKTVVVTGGNGGIGLGLARGVARQGANVAIWARNTEKSERAVRELEELGASALALACDVTSEQQVADALAATLERFGRVDTCFANAGFGSACDPLEMSLEEWRRVLAVNLDGVFVTLRDTARHMVERGGGGRLVAVSSMVEHFGSPLQPHYAASKGGVGALVRSLAVRLARHDIQVNSLEPGWIETEATAPVVGSGAFSEAIVRRTPARRWGKPDDLEGIAAYLASDVARFHTGDSIRIDGGYTVF